ncbi:hypothetical protein A2118_01255 [Candidatus Kaiserbacteria bacterium GWA2_50_9]|uniref:Uncharacterized protein n=1 Tax=Candidatus Kaiserbacteria bacterium GWA2_50_9 TaxID=1798474 RepID=A0A1F6BSQ8_9BACT|nr:MAG: hypothetical protein A2118_01255 [Candidatus Kaiserbacteria bacterium GWA2_50_9]
MLANNEELGMSNDSINPKDLRHAIEQHFEQTPAAVVVRRAEELKPPPGNEMHRHPQNDEERIFGRLLEDREELEEGDVSPDPNTKKWEKIPEVHVGARLPSGHKTKFVRPVKWPGGGDLAGLEGMFD